MHLREIVNSILASTACSSSLGDNCAKRIYNGDRLLWSSDFYDLTYYPKLVSSAQKGKLYALLNPTYSICANNGTPYIGNCSDYTVGDYGEVKFHSPQCILIAKASSSTLTTSFGLYAEHTDSGYKLSRNITEDTICVGTGEIYVNYGSSVTVPYRLLGQGAPSYSLGFSQAPAKENRFGLYELSLFPRTRYYIEPATEIELGADYCFIVGDKIISSHSTTISGVDPGFYWVTYQDITNYQVCPDGSIIFDENHMPLIKRGQRLTEGGLINLDLSIYDSWLCDGYFDGDDRPEIDNNSYMSGYRGYLSYNSIEKVKFTSGGERFKVYKLTPVNQ